MAEAYIIDAFRSPRGRGKACKGSLSGLHPQELLGQVLRGTIERAGVDPATVEVLERSMRTIDSAITA